MGEKDRNSEKLSQKQKQKIVSQRFVSSSDESDDERLKIASGSDNEGGSKKRRRIGSDSDSGDDKGSGNGAKEVDLALVQALVARDLDQDQLLQVPDHAPDQ